MRADSLPSHLVPSTGIKAQAALGNKNLDGVERMSVAGHGAVPAYPTGELSGDHGALPRAELARPFKIDAAQLSASLFTDSSTYNLQQLLSEAVLRFPIKKIILLVQSKAKIGSPCFGRRY